MRLPKIGFVGGDAKVVLVRILTTLTSSLQLMILACSLSSALFLVALDTPVTIVPRELLSFWPMGPFSLGFN